MDKSARSVYNASRILTDSISSTVELRRAQSGTYFFVSSSATIAITLPDPVDGNYFRFIVKNGMTQQMTVQSQEGLNMYGPLVTEQGGAGVTITENSNVSITLGAGAAAGSYLDVMCSNSAWYVSGIASGSAWS
jgi:hypothetical protein